jgi:hypothetical protein
VIYFSESETRVIESASAFNAERECFPVSLSSSETASEVLSSATPLCVPKELKLEEPNHTGLSVRAVVENRYMDGETRDEGWRVATSAYRTIQISVGLRPQKSLFTRHGINKKILSCFFEKRSIVLQSAVRAGGISPLIHHPSQQSTDMERLGLSDAPQELIDEIIDHCSGNKRTLIACSLISRAWVYRTRKHLFSTLTLTDRTLPVWCGIVVAPPMATGSEPQPIAGGSSPLPSHRLSSYVTSLQLVPKLFPISPRRNLCADQLVQVKSHFSAFTHLRSLTLTAVSFLTFEDATLEACFGSLAKTVWELKLWSCSLNEERFFALVRLFTLLESFHAGGDRWGHSSSIVKTEGLERERPTLRGSFTGSGFTDDRDGLLESLATAETEYHTITLGWNLPSTIAKFNALFAKCKDHLKTLSLTALERGTWHHGTSSFSLWPLPVPVRSDQRNIEQMV